MPIRSVCVHKVVITSLQTLQKYNYVTDNITDNITAVIVSTNTVFSFMSIITCSVI